MQTLDTPGLRHTIFCYHEHFVSCSNVATNNLYSTFLFKLGSILLFICYLCLLVYAFYSEYWFGYTHNAEWFFHYFLIKLIVKAYYLILCKHERAKNKPNIP